jgi:hypothetical protein
MLRHAVESPGAIGRAAVRTARRAARAGARPDVVPGAAPSPVPRADAVTDFAAGRSTLEARLGRAVPAFAYPSGRATAPMRAAVARMGHATARTSRPGINRVDRLRPLALTARTWTADTTIEDARGWIAETVTQGGWLIEVFHVVAPDAGGYAWSVTADRFRSHLDDLVAAGLPVDTQTNVHRALTRRSRP